MSAHAHAGRRVENVLAYGGFALFGLYVIVVEIAPSLGLLACTSRSVPWGVLAGMLICVAPKTLGRARAAGVIDKVMEFVPGTRARRTRISRAQGGDDETD